MPEAQLADVEALFAVLDGSSIGVPVAQASGDNSTYLARLNYVHQNAVKRRLVRKANKYRWCSAAWYERSATRAQVKTIYSFKMDRVKIDDDYEPVI